MRSSVSPDRQRRDSAGSDSRVRIVSVVPCVAIVRMAIVLVIVTVLPLACLAGPNEDGGSSSERPGLRLPARNGGREGHAGAPHSRSTSGTGGLWTTLISLAVIIGGLCGAVYLLKPHLGTRRRLSIEALELLGHRSIDQKVAIHLVRCGRRVLVLSVSPEGARTLSEITDPNEVQRLVDACGGTSDERATASNQTSNVAMRPKSPPPFPLEGSRRA